LKAAKRSIDLAVFSPSFQFAAAFTIDRLGRRGADRRPPRYGRGVLRAVGAARGTTSVALLIVVFDLTNVFANWDPA
jgi:hypothetical protein